jgi:uncharacterized YccA/Bax inhibitor family protein
VRPIGKAYKAADQLGALKENLGARNVLAASIYRDNTDRLCNTINDTMTMKSILAVIATMAAMFIVEAHQTDFTNMQYTLKFIAAASGLLLPLVWDFSRCEKQKYWNKELREP